MPVFWLPMLYLHAYFLENSLCLNSAWNNLPSYFPGGPLSNGKRGYQARPWTHKKHPNHIFFRYENRPWIRIFACIFLNLSIMSFPKFVYMTKNTPFFPILHVFAPLNDVWAYSAWSWKTTLITWIFGRAWYPPWHSSGPPVGYVTSILKVG